MVYYHHCCVMVGHRCFDAGILVRVGSSSGYSSMYITENSIVAEGYGGVTVPLPLH